MDGIPMGMDGTIDIGFIIGPIMPIGAVIIGPIIPIGAIIGPIIDMGFIIGAIMGAIIPIGAIIGPIIDMGFIIGAIMGAIIPMGAIMLMGLNMSIPPNWACAGRAGASRAARTMWRGCMSSPLGGISAGLAA